MEALPTRCGGSSNRKLGHSLEKGRGKLARFVPLLGTWVAEGDSALGPGHYARSFAYRLHKSHIQLTARWDFAERSYEESGLLGLNREGLISFWSFTSDGKQSHGVLSDVSDLHSEAIGFEADMPAGRARLAYWPDAASVDCMHWAVEAKTQKGWSRMVHHQYRKA